MSDKAKMARRTLLLASLPTVALLAYLGMNLYGEARVLALNSYLASVCLAIDEYKVRNGAYPTALEQIDASMLDYDVGIPLALLNYDVGESGASVSYKPNFGEEVSCESSEPSD